jgi:PKD repeat protein
MKTKNILLIICIIFSTQIHAQQWKEIGPILFPTNSSGQINGLGRVTQIKFHPSAANIMYATSASGGLYKTTDTGMQWQLLGTDNFAVSSLSCICIDNTDDQILYLGTGDPNYYSVDFSIYKSTDGGITWLPANAGITNLLPIDIIMDPTNNQRLITATNNGIWQTINGGTSWTNVKTGGAFTDVKQIPNTNKLIATTATQVWVSLDFGATWIQNTSATFLQAGASGIRIAVSIANNNIVYVISNGNNGVVFKSTNSASTFTNIYNSTTVCLFCYDDNPANAGQGNYNMAACADPMDANHLYVAAHCLWESNNGGLTWQRKTAWPEELHTDHHQFEFSPFETNKLWSANDGGVWLREGLMDSLWQPMCNGITASEIYKAASSPVIRKLVSVGTQDNGEHYYDKSGWYTNRGGDWGSRMMFDYSPENYVYYLENGERRPFTPQSGSNSYNSPFIETNSSRIAFNANLKNISLLAKDTIWYSSNINTATPTWINIANMTNSIRDIIISTANPNTAYSIHSGKFNRIMNLNTVPIISSANPPSTAGTLGSIASVKNNDSIVYLSCNAKMYRSANSGTTWTNITYNLPATNILKIYHDDFSNNESVYICSGNQIFSKTKTDTVWTNISSNLPKIANITSFMLFNDSTIASKLRVSYYGRGVWELPMHPNYVPVADFTADKSLICLGNNIAFENESVNDSLTYAWTFAGGTPSSSTAKNPIITYNTAGIFAVTLIATNANGSNTKTINNYVEVMPSKPKVDSLVGNALQLNGIDGFGNGGKLNVNTNTMTMMCWIKPQGVQNDWAGLIFKRGNGEVGGVSIKSNNEIRYHWNDQNYWFSSGLFAIDNQWNHCALVITPTATTIYVNGIAATDVTINDPMTFDTDIMIGIDPNGGDRKFKGLIEEVAIYNKALTINEIREQMHLVKNTNISSDSLKAYWQMNTISSNNTILNKANCNNQMSYSTSANFVKSTAPFGGGISQRINANSAGLLNLPNANTSITLPSSAPFPNGEICVSHILNSPDQMPNNSVPSQDYFIVDNYGTNKNFNALSALQLDNCGQIAGAANQFALYNRGANADGNTWSSSLCNATSITTGNNGSITFNPATNITSMGQFVVQGPYWPLALGQINNKISVEVFPNPSNHYISIKKNKEEIMNLQICNAEGKKILETQLIENIYTIKCSNWSSGIYFYSIKNKETIINGKLEVIH